MTYKALNDLPLGARDVTFHFPFCPLSSGCHLLLARSVLQTPADDIPLVGSVFPFFSQCFLLTLHILGYRLTSQKDTFMVNLSTIDVLHLCRFHLAHFDTELCLCEK